MLDVQKMHIRGLVSGVRVEKAMLPVRTAAENAAHFRFTLALENECVESK